MKPITLTITEAQYQNIADLIAAGGKSPATGLDGMVRAVDALRGLAEAVQASEKAKAEAADKADALARTKENVMKYAVKTEPKEDAA
jgi:hypothetical protein